MRRVRGLSMIETLFSLFFIATTLLLTSQLLISATQLQHEVEKAMGGAHLADQILSQVRANAKKSGNMPTPQSGENFDFPGYQYQIEVVKAGLYSPCSTRELQFPVTERRWIADPGCQVKVTVTWEPTSARNRAVAYALILRELPRVKELRVDADGGNTLPVAKDGTVQYTARAVDSGGREVPGVFFSWYCAPRTGNGLAEAKTRDGRTGQFTHVYRNPYRPAPTYFPAGSECLLRTRARINGKEFECDSSAIPLTDI
ncbi:MAG: hypothetical protein KF760_18195 [Candidatus Eremiobacteraeota bacterium]|nr:hypothetical protein [Candidatus Eremiobacteraeota bacterium]MCW5866727.1 hypothetical protein [Candidatus Eremiobacteraeota bacterium]